MKVAFFSPLPPAKSGIADYSAALLEELKPRAEVTAFSAKPARFDPAQFDIALYQIGNNSYHDFCYEMALEHPGVVVIHEANLHHLIADITIKRGDWDAYLREVEFDGGPTALQFAQRVRTLEVGPDYEGVAMLRRLLSRRRRPSCIATASEQRCAPPASPDRSRAFRMAPGFRRRIAWATASSWAWMKPRRSSGPSAF